MTAQDLWLAELSRQYPALTGHQLSIVREIVGAFIKPVSANQLRDDFISTAAFNYLTARLVAHHTTSTNPLKKENFEHALEYVFRKEGKRVPSSSDPTRRGADIVVDGIRVSLKTFSAKSKKPSLLDISKFAECRWLREPLAARDAAKIRSLTNAAVSSHLREYDRIFMLAHHRPTPDKVVYRLYELPKIVFEAVENLTDADYESVLRRGTQTLTLPITINGRRAANVSLDGSVEKLRFLGIEADFCSLHARWELDD